jgi:hypothetical protein
MLLEELFWKLSERAGGRYSGLAYGLTHCRYYKIALFYPNRPTVVSEILVDGEAHV